VSASGPAATPFGRRLRPRPARLASLALLALALALPFGCAGPQAARAPDPPPAAVASGAPRCEAWSADGLAAVGERLAGLDTTAMMATAGGRVLLEYGDTARVSYVASVRKSVLSILFGIHEAEGSVHLGATLAELGIDDHQTLSPAEKRATVRDLLMARSGVYHPAANPGDNLDDAPPRGSRLPGGHFLYSNWDFNALGSVFRQQTGRDLFDALEERLARPLGMQDFDRARHVYDGDLTRSRHPAYHMHFSTRDMLRIGQLMLQEGRWEGRQIVPAGWVHVSTSPLTPRAELNPDGLRQGAFGYGYSWWAFDDPERGPAYAGGFAALGAGGQRIVVLPALKLVVAHKTVRDGGRNVSSREFLDVLGLLVAAHRPECAG
jgi:CubicO group peptidase (beta-lactamase class C family)